MNALVERLNKAIERFDKAQASLCAADESVLLTELRDAHEDLDSLSDEAKRALAEYREADLEYTEAVDAVEEFDAEQERKYSEKDFDTF